jgi:hypothetical protein
MQAVERMKNSKFKQLVVTRRAVPVRTELRVDAVIVGARTLAKSRNSLFMTVRVTSFISIGAYL